MSRADWQTYIDTLSRINTTAAGLMKEYIAEYGLVDIDSAIQYAYGISTKYGEAAAALACQMYDEIALAQGVIISAAEPAATATLSEVGEAINGARKQSDELIPGVVGLMVKRAGADTMLKNAVRDKAEFAWVTFGDTCAFCMTIASWGWRTASEKVLSGGHAQHIHSNCDCEFAVRFKKDFEIEGYDYRKYKEMYDNADGSSSKAKINSMRRMQYASHKDQINAQKRAAYARRVAEEDDEE